MSKFTVKEITQMSGSIAALLNARIDVYVQFRLRKFLKEAVEALRNIEQKRNELIEQFGVEDGQGNFTMEMSALVKAGKKDAIGPFNEAMEKLMEEEVIFPEVKPAVKIRELEKANLSAADIMNLDFLLDQEDDGKESKIIPLEKVVEPPNRGQ